MIALCQHFRNPLGYKMYVGLFQGSCSCRCQAGRTGHQPVPNGLPCCQCLCQHCSMSLWNDLRKSQQQTFSHNRFKHDFFTYNYANIFLLCFVDLLTSSLCDTTWHCVVCYCTCSLADLQQQLPRPVHYLQKENCTCACAAVDCTRVYTCVHVT